MTVAVGGLDTVSNATTTAWQDVLVSPDAAAVSTLGSGGYSLETRFGHTALSWALDSASRQLTLNVTMPIGSTAHVRPPLQLPGGLGASAVTDGSTGAQLWSAGAAGAVAGALARVGAGRHTLLVQYAPL